MEDFFQFDWSFLERVGDNPFQAMWFFFANGGWIVFLIVFAWIGVKAYQASRQNIFGAKKQWVLLAINVPRLHEQGPRAVENMFAYLAGAHSTNSWVEDWFVGRTQDTIACEIVSIEGHVQFLIRTTRGLRDLAEAAIYSQYPDADITEVEDYTAKVPHHFPDEEWDMWGTQFIPVKSDVYPLKTYKDFEDKVSGEFKDPMSALLESMSRIGPGEQAWFQIVLTPIEQKQFSKHADAMVKKLTGQKVEHKKGTLEQVAELPLSALKLLADEMIGGGSHAAAPAKKDPMMLTKLLHMTTTEKDIVTAIENKASKIVFLAKIRLIYIAKKQVMVKSRIANTIIGAIKQLNTNNMQSLKPDLKHVGMSGALWWFKTSRNNHRKHHLMDAYRYRSNWSGLPNMHLCTEELATLWHFPHTEQVKSPQLRKTETKRSEPPANIPFG